MRLKVRFNSAFVRLLFLQIKLKINSKAMIDRNSELTFFIMLLIGRQRSTSRTSEAQFKLAAEGG